MIEGSDNITEKGTTNFAIVIPMELPEDLKKEIDIGIQQFVAKKLASADLIKDTAITTSPEGGVSVEGGSSPEGGWGSFFGGTFTAGFAPRKEIFEINL